MKKFLLSVLSVFFALPMFAQQISVDEATNSALQFFGNGTRAKAGVELAYTSAQDGKNHFFVFNSAVKDGGFVIVGADKAAYEILGYSDSGSFDYSQIPENMKWWLNQYDLQIAEGIRQGVDSRKVTRGTRAERSSIEPLIKTQWNQGNPYNSHCPQSGSSYCLTGCVATAMAQIMYYHKNPVGNTTSIPAYTSEGLNQHLAELEPCTFNWGTNSSPMTNDEISKLMRYCGQSVEMNYGVSSSGAQPLRAATALVRYFGYANTIRIYRRECWIDNDWSNILYNELIAGRPIIYSGNNFYDTQGHTFICDGYNNSDETFHFNWGWSGYQDGYFNLNSVALSSDLDFRYGQDIITGIKSGGTELEDYYMSIGKHYIIEGDSKSSYYILNENGQTIQSGTKINITARIYNLSISNITASLAVKFNKIDQDPIYVPFCSVNNLSNYSYNYNTWQVSTIGIPTGDYTLSFAFSTDGYTWKDMDVTAEENLSIKIIENSSDIYLSSIPTVGNGENVVCDNTKFSIKFKVKNNTSENKNFSSSAFIYPNIAGEVSSVLYVEGSKEIPAKSEALVELKCNAPSLYNNFSENQRYFFIIKDMSERYYFNAVSNLKHEYSLSTSGIGTIILPFEAEIPDGFKVYECTSINEQTLVLTEASKIAQFTPYIINGTANASTSFNGPDVPPAKATYTKGLLKGVVDAYNLQSDDYILQTQDGTTAFYKVGDGAANGKAATKYRCTLNLPTSLSSTLTSVGFPAGIGTTAIDEVFENAVSDVVGIYSIDGKQQSTLQKGLNILRKADGSAVKVIVK